MKYKRWYYRLPGVFYANGPVTFQNAVSESFFRDYIREDLELSRLPKGFEFWPE